MTTPVRVFVLTSQVGMDGSWLRGATRKHIDEDVEIGLRTVGNVIGTHRNLAVWKRGLLQIYLRERRRVCERVAAAAESSREGDCRLEERKTPSADFPCSGKG